MKAAATRTTMVFRQVSLKSPALLVLGFFVCPRCFLGNRPTACKGTASRGLIRKQPLLFLPAQRGSQDVINHLTTDTAQDGETLSVVGDTYRILITGEQTGGAYASIDMLIPPGGGPGLHSHPEFQEAIYVMESEVVVKTKEQTFTATKGSFVNIPKGGVVHDFKNETDKNARLLCVVVPAGLEAFFRKSASRSPPDSSCRRPCWGRTTKSG